MLAGLVLMAALGFLLGRLTYDAPKPPEIAVEEMFAPALNYTPIVSGIQSNPLSCEGKIKGSSSQVYHVPGGSFYNRVTNPARCFETEQQALEAGFRKSDR